MISLFFRPLLPWFIPLAMHVLGLKKENFIPDVKDVLGMATFLNLSEDKSAW